MRQTLISWSRFLAARGAGFLALSLPIVFNPYARAPFEPVKVTFFRCTTAAMVVAFLLYKVLTRKDPAKVAPSRPRRWERMLPACVLAYGAVQILATILSVDRDQSLWGFGTDGHGTVTTLALLAFFFIARWSFDTEEQRESVGTAILVGSVPVTLYAIVQLLGLDPLSWTTDSVSPVQSTMGRSNFLGAYLAMVIPFVLARVVLETETSSKRTPVLELVPLVGLVLVQVTTLLATEARAAGLALTGALAVFTAMLAWSRRRRIYVWLCATALILGLGLLPVLNRVDLLRATGLSSPYREAGQTFESMRAHTIESRLEIWKSTLALVPERWLIGFGPETFPSVFAERYPSLAFPDSGDLRLTDPHNLLLSQLFATGVLGLSVFLVLVGAFFVAVAKRMQRVDRSVGTAGVAAECAAMVAYLIHSQFSPDAIVLSMFFWVLVAMGGRTSDPA